MSQVDSEQRDATRRRADETAPSRTDTSQEAWWTHFDAADLGRALEGGLSIGPFEAEKLCGRGGMGLVFRGDHRHTGVPVALKVIQPTTASNARRRFHEEVRAHAALRHPGVAHLFEYGEIGEGTSEATEGLLPKGSPYVAMEFADRGSLHDALPLSCWRDVRRTLLQTLDALAHAHARDLVHRDLKPENLLVFETDDDSPTEWRVKVSDFGIAHALGEERTRQTDELVYPIGTPSYMAPEQFRGQWRDYGPWTDLYAVGCIAWELVSGRPPFQGEGFRELAHLHDEADRPRLDPLFPVPEALEQWVHRCMAVDPERRFRYAADAARALSRCLDTEQSDGHSTTTASPDSEPRDARTQLQTLVFHRDVPDSEPTLRLHTWASPQSDRPRRTANEDSPRSATLAAGADERPAVPESWRRTESSRHTPQLVGTGLGLFGLRKPPFVDRDSERERIWRALREADEDGAPSVVLVVGESGAGKSRLVEWMATRARELGAAELFRAVHTPGGGSRAEGLSGMLRRALRAQKLDRGELYEYLAESLPPLPGERDHRERDARATSELIHPTGDSDHRSGPAFRFSSPAEKCALVSRLLRRFEDRRTPFVWLDDAQWNDLAVTLVEQLLESPFEQPGALVTATLRSDLLTDDPRLRDRVETLEAYDRCTRIDLSRLDASDHREFVARMLPLEDDLAEHLAARTEGNPLFATQMLRHLVDRGDLVARPQGFQLQETASPTLPRQISDLWIQRLERLVADLELGADDAIWRCIERAAILGREVDTSEWRALSAELGVDHPDRLRDALIDRGLAEPTDDGWALAHGLLVEALERRADRAGRIEAHHRTCARLIERLYPSRSRQTAARRAHHLLGSGDLEEALDPLLEEFQRCRRLGDIDRTREVLERRQRVLDRIDAPEDDPRRIENDIWMNSWRLSLDSSLDEVLESLRSGRRRAEAADLHHLVAKSRTGMSYCFRCLGEFRQAVETAEGATRAARRADDRTLEAEACDQLGWVEYARGRLDAAERHFERGRQLAAESGTVWLRLKMKRSRAALEMGRGDYDTARETYREVLSESRDAGFRTTEVRALNGLGDLERFHGDAGRARELYCAVGRLSREQNRRFMAILAELNLAQLDLLDGAFEDAAARLDVVERKFERKAATAGHRHLLRWCRLACAAGTRDWSAFDALALQFDDDPQSDAHIERDHPWILEVAGDVTAEAGERERAAPLWDRSRRLWEAFGDPEAAARVERKLEE